MLNSQLLRKRRGKQIFSNSKKSYNHILGSERRKKTSFTLKIFRPYQSVEKEKSGTKTGPRRKSDSPAFRITLGALL